MKKILFRDVRVDGFFLPKLLRLGRHYHARPLRKILHDGLRYKNSSIFAAVFRQSKIPGPNKNVVDFSNQRWVIFPGDRWLEKVRN